MEGPWLVDRLWEAHVTFSLLHNKLLQVAIWLGMWTVSLSRVLTTWKTSVYWYVIHLCEVVVLGVRSFGVPYVSKHGIRPFMKSHFRFWSRSRIGVAETLKGFLFLNFLCIFCLWELFHCIWSVVSIGKYLSFHQKSFPFAPETPISANLKV